MQGELEEDNSKFEKSKVEYQLITNDKEANKILTIILKDEACVIGVDVEAAVEMSRFGILCLLQVID